MASIIEKMKAKAVEIAEFAHAKIASFDEELAAIEKKKFEINAEIDKARGALKRAADFPVKSGADYLCPVCWVDPGIHSIMRPIGSASSLDVFRCPKCHFEDAF